MARDGATPYVSIRGAIGHDTREIIDFGARLRRRDPVRHLNGLARATARLRKKAIAKSFGPHLIVSSVKNLSVVDIEPLAAEETSRKNRKRTAFATGRPALSVPYRARRGETIR
jgi:hypothetical protein